MKMKNVSLVGLYYQGKDDEIQRVLDIHCSMKSVAADLKRALQIESREPVRLIFDPYEQDRFGHSILNLLINGKHEQLALALWRVGVDEMIKDGAKEVPLFQAIKQRQDQLVLAMVESMVKNGVGDIVLNSYMLKGKHSAFNLAVEFSSLEIVEAMLKAGGNSLSKGCFGTTPLYTAATKGFEDKVELMFKFMPENPEATLIRDAYRAATPYPAFKSGSYKVCRMFEEKYPSILKEVD